MTERLYVRRDHAIMWVVPAVTGKKTPGGAGTHTPPVRRLDVHEQASEPVSCTSGSCAPRSVLALHLLHVLK